MNGSAAVHASILAHLATTQTLALSVGFAGWSGGVWLWGVWTGRQIRRRQDWWDGWARRHLRGRARTWPIPEEQSDD